MKISASSETCIQTLQLSTVDQEKVRNCVREYTYPQGDYLGIARAARIAHLERV